MKKEYKKWKDWEMEYLKENYPFGNQEEIEKTLNLNWPSIKYKAAQLGVNRFFGVLSKKYYYNENYFEKIDSEEKAYFLGLLYADGNIHITKYSKNLKISLIEPDSYILEKFREELQLEKPLETIFQKDKISKIEENIITSNYDMKRISVSSDKLCDDLIKLGCLSKKSLILTFPSEEQVPKEFQRHFIRGYFDGDGTISSGISGGYDYVNMGIVGTFSFLNTLQEILIENTEISKTKLYQRKNISNMNYSGRKQLLKIKNYLYRNCSIYLERKFKKFPN